MERYKFWSTIKRKLGETPTELAARVRQMATTCDFPAIKNPLDEEMRTCFICAVNNDAILKSVFREKEEKLTFAKAVEIATEVEEAAKTAKAQAYSKPDEVQMIHTKKPQRNNHHHHHQKSPPPPTKPSASTTARCYRCGKNGHAMKDCRLSNAVCNFCGKKGHIEAACITEQRSSKVNLITTSTINSLTDEVKEPSPSVAVTINNRKFPFLVDTGASCNLLSSSTWKKIGTPTLQKDETRPLISASNDVIPTSGSVDLDVTVTTEDGDANSQILPFTVTDQLDILGTNAINSLQLTIRNNPVKVHVDNIRIIRSLQHLQESCLQICKEFPDLWKPELGCLKDYSLEVKFKPDVTPRFCKPRTVPFAVQEDLNQADNVGIAKGIWKHVTFNEYGTPVVPVRKQSQPNQPSGAVRVCGDYSVFINGQLETHRQPMPLPEDLMRRLDGTHYFSKVDLADAYNQIELGPESQRRLALGTHRGVLLQTRLPFGISSATGYFQDVMNQPTSDLPGVAVYLDDILISGKTAEDHLNNLRRLLKRLNDRCLRCRIQKCVFAQDSRLLVGPGLSFDGEEGDNDVDTVCTIRVMNSQLQPHSRNQLKDATNRDPVLSEVKRYVREGWTQKIDSPDVQEFKKYAASVSVTDDCLINGNRVVIPEAVQPQILDILHLGHFGIQRMKQLARSAVYWPHIDSQIEDTCRGCVSCAEHQNKPPKPANHPWMMPEKPWSRIHVDHAINFMGNNWLIVTDAYSKYPFIHQTSSTSTQATTTLLEEDFAYFGYPHTIVSDNATTFSSAEFQLWCHQRGIKHLTGAPYHPATNGAAERMVQSFKQSLKKSNLPPRPALQDFLMQYRRTPLNTGFSPSQLLNGRQLRTKIDALLPSPAHIAQEHQAREATKSQQKEQTAAQHVRTAYDVGTPCYALYCGPR